MSLSAEKAASPLQQHGPNILAVAKWNYHFLTVAIPHVLVYVHAAVHEQKHVRGWKIGGGPKGAEDAGIGLEAGYSWSCNMDNIAMCAGTIC